MALSEPVHTLLISAKLLFLNIMGFLCRDGKEQIVSTVHCKPVMSDHPSVRAFNGVAPVPHLIEGPYFVVCLHGMRSKSKRSADHR